MATFIGLDRFPNYVAESTELSNSTIPGVTNIGSTVFMTDSGEWYIVSEDTTLKAFLLPQTLA